MLKLTRVKLNIAEKAVEDGDGVWINPAHIRMMHREIIEWGEFTTINLGNRTIDVRETPELIVATLAHPMLPDPKPAS